MKNGFEVRGNVVAIHLSHCGNRLECLIDAADLPKVEAFPGTWYAMWSKDSQTFYVVGRAGGKATLLHRYLTDAPEGQEVDHLFHYGLDNRRSQIKVCDRRENAQNRQGANSNSKSGVRGVYWIPRKQRWGVQLKINGKRSMLGSYATIEEASRVSALAIREGVDAVPPRHGRRAKSLTEGLTEKSQVIETEGVA